MKLWIWHHKKDNGRVYPHDIYPLSKVYSGNGQKVNGFVPVAAHAFLRKKYAIEYMKSLNWPEGISDYYQLSAVNL